MPGFIGSNTALFFPRFGMQTGGYRGSTLPQACGVESLKSQDPMALHD